MNKPYLDTSVILCGFHPNEKHQQKALKLVNINHLISPIVYDELENIYKRRERIYNSILLLSSNGYNELTLSDLYKRCFKSNYLNNRHDNSHLNQIFSHIIRKLNVRETDKLTNELLDNFLLELSNHFADIKFSFKSYFIFLQNPENYNNRVIKENIGNKYNKLNYYFKKIAGYKQNKNDIRILIHGVEYSCYKCMNLDIISNDDYIIKINPDIKKYAIRVFKRLFFDIFHLPNYVI